MVREGASPNTSSLFKIQGHLNVRREQEGQPEHSSLFEE